MSDLDYLADLRRESVRFHECLSNADPAAPVPSCPGWTATDLLWHLTEVQTSWGTIVRERLQTEPTRWPEQPDVDYQGLLTGFVEASNALLQTLGETTDDVAVWTWADEQSVGFIRRRQAQEALIHRLDAELTVGQVGPLGSALADDGVDEALRVMFGGYPAWAHHRSLPGAGRVIATDTGTRWDFTLGRWCGTGPTSGKTFDEPTIQVLDEPTSAEPAFTVSGSAGELDAWLWGRKAFTEPVIDGDQVAAAAFLAVIAAGIA
ncbi:uncharacterized protein (TIGR03083 family) [Nakamurella sp. UYEF19]|uniref:maleylpyruvate isomerase family mycothiol-dependent enzyme n=1 Tax=Nakamurella sp. UYEF19 TaxID=1756392 RepID=UPI00339B516C